METRFFAGTRITSEIKITLSQSIDNELLKIPFNGKEYLGLYLENPQPTVKEIRTLLDQLDQRFQKTFPNINPQWIVFPQIFLS